jgi:hypothetical protein
MVLTLTTGTLVTAPGLKLHTAAPGLVNVLPAGAANVTTTPGGINVVPSTE